MELKEPVRLATMLRTLGRRPCFRQQQPLPNWPRRRQPRPDQSKIQSLFDDVILFAYSAGQTQLWWQGRDHTPHNGQDAAQRGQDSWRKQLFYVAGYV